MANFELVGIYTQESADWLKNQGCPHPPPNLEGEMPSGEEMIWALNIDDIYDFDIPEGEQDLCGADLNGHTFRVAGFDWDHRNSIPGEYFTVYRFEPLFPALIRLSERVGRLFLYPDSGAPPIVIEAGLDSEAVLNLYNETEEEIEWLQAFYERLYRPNGDVQKRFLKPRGK